MMCRRGETAGAVAFGTTRKMCNDELSPINETLMQQMARFWLKFSLTRSKCLSPRPNRLRIIS